MLSSEFMVGMMQYDIVLHFPSDQGSLCLSFDRHGSLAKVERHPSGRENCPFLLIHISPAWEVIMSMCNSTGADIKVGISRGFCMLLWGFVAELLQTINQFRSDRRLSTWDIAGCLRHETESRDEWSWTLKRDQLSYGSNLMIKISGWWPGTSSD